MKRQIKLTVNGRDVYVAPGTRLSDILEIEQPCGGQGTCGKCKVLVDGKETLACSYTVHKEIAVTAREAAIFSQTGIAESGKRTARLCFVLDVGTTTLALALVSLDECRVVKTITAANPQRRLGADVITRIAHCRKHGVHLLQSLLVNAVNEMLAALEASAEVLYVCGNTTMLHTLFGVDCGSIGVAPYTPVFLCEKQEDAQKVGIRGVKTVCSLPSVSSFVGADIVAGVHRVGMPREGSYRLLIDLGTNAEVVLYTSNKGVATAAAAGPCFEGANIRCGTAATTGAVCAFSLQEDGCRYQTIGNAPPTGLCGTGLIDVIAALLRAGILDESGFMEEDFPIAANVFLTPADVRQYQLAKSAVCSAILTLMEMQGIGFEAIDRVYLSGGFSAKIDLENAAISGLIPPELAQKAVAIDNSSLQGACEYACRGGDLARIADMLCHVDLSAHPRFAELFIENMAFGAQDI